jgi:hypothetical protein
VGNPTPQLIWGYQPLILPAAVRVAANSTGGSEILLIVSGQPLLYLQGLLTAMAELNLGDSVLVRLTLKGDFIWGRDDPTMFLDGDSFGITRTDPDGSTHIGLRLPKSGDGRRGGDFQMWFRLALPLTVSGLSFNPNVITAGQATTLTVTLSSPALGGADVILTDSNPAVLTLPGSVTVPPNQASVSVPVTQTLLPPGIGAVTIQATGTLQNTSATGSLTINPALSVIKLTLSQSTLAAGVGFTGTVTLSAPAGSGGASVAVASNNAIAKVAQPTVLVPAGQTTATFLITTTPRPPNSPPITATITATLGASTVSAALTV